MSPSNERFISWVEFQHDTQTLAKALKNKEKWNGIVAVTRGGLIPAGIIAQELNIKHIETFCISSYNDKDRNEAEIIKEFCDSKDGENWIIIDDLVDSGATAKIIRSYLPNAHIATVYAKPSGAAEANTYAVNIPQETWLHFPWEYTAE